MMDFLLFFLPLSVVGNVALILTVIGDIKKEREKEIRIRMLEADGCCKRFTRPGAGRVVG